MQLSEVLREENLKDVLMLEAWGTVVCNATRSVMTLVPLSINNSI